jgi:hypothetical protein
MELQAADYGCLVGPRGIASMIKSTTALWCWCGEESRGVEAWWSCSRCAWLPRTHECMRQGCTLHNHPSTTYQVHLGTRRARKLRLVSYKSHDYDSVNQDWRDRVHSATTRARLALWSSPAPASPPLIPVQICDTSLRGSFVILHTPGQPIQGPSRLPSTCSALSEVGAPLPPPPCCSQSCRRRVRTTSWEE